MILFSAACAEERRSDQPGCALGLEDYPVAIALHRRLLRTEPNNALAHYHLGFACGITGHVSQEINQYSAPIKLGLIRWELFSNLGVAYLSLREYAKAAAALETAVWLEPERAQTHFNLAIAYERCGRLTKALQQIEPSRRLAPEDPDVENMNTIACAGLGDFVCARDLWTQLVRVTPSFAPARANLMMLGGASQANGQLKQPSVLSRAPGPVIRNYVGAHQVSDGTQPVPDIPDRSDFKADRPVLPDGPTASPDDRYGN